MGTIVTNAIRKIYRDLIKDVVKDLGESIYVYGPPEEADCPNCLYDLTTGQSKNVFDTTFVSAVTIFDKLISPKSFTRGRCPVCKGKGKLYNRAPSNIRALVKWRSEDGDMEHTPAGVEGSNIVRVKARRSSYERLRDCEYAVIDGVKCLLVKPPVFRGLGKQDELVVAYFQAVDVGHSVKE